MESPAGWVMMAIIPSHGESVSMAIKSPLAPCTWAKSPFLNRRPGNLWPALIKSISWWFPASCFGQAGSAGSRTLATVGALHSISIPPSKISQHNEIEFSLRYPSRTFSWIWSPKTFFFSQIIFCFSFLKKTLRRCRESLLHNKE